jgi:hypothetical protein
MSKPDWRAVTCEALHPDNLPRVLAGFGFPHYCGAVPRGSIAWWPPAYAAAPRNSPHRACFAALNRAMRDAEAHMLADRDRVTVVCGYSGEWRSADGAQRGPDLPSLGALRWGITYGKAAARIARAIGMPRIPEAAHA